MSLSLQDKGPILKDSQRIIACCWDSTGMVVVWVGMVYV